MKNSYATEKTIRPYNTSLFKQTRQTENKHIFESRRALVGSLLVTRPHSLVVERSYLLTV